jgi:hypothetical protein
MKNLIEFLELGKGSPFGQHRKLTFKRGELYISKELDFSMTAML